MAASGYYIAVLSCFKKDISSKFLELTCVSGVFVGVLGA